MSALFLAARCACGAPGYLEAVSRKPDGAFEPPKHDWRYKIEPAATPVAPPPGDYRVAVHEAGHAVFAHALGRPIAAITINGQPHVAWNSAPHNPVATAMISMAADHVERLLLRRAVFRPYDGDVIASFGAVRRLAFGGCDKCTTALAIIGMHGAEAPDNVLLAAYRQIEAKTIDILREPRTQAAIRRLASSLMRLGEIGGGEAHNIIRALDIEFGAVRLPEGTPRA